MTIFDVLLVILVSMMPGIEARGSIPLAYALGLGPLPAFIIPYIFSSLPSIPIILGLEYVEEKIISRISILFKLYKLVVERARKKSIKIAKHKIVYVGLALYVAIPLPLTGVWTGSLIAYIMGLNEYKSIIAIILGNLVASTLIFLAVESITIFI